MVNQRVPFPSSHSLFESRQHGVCPDAWIHPRPEGRRFSGRHSRKRHFGRWSFLGSGHSSSTSLHPFAPPELPGFNATMNALTSVRWALRTRVSDCSALRHMNSHWDSEQLSLVHVLVLLSVPSPTTPVSLVVALSHYPSAQRASATRTPLQTCRPGCLFVTVLGFANAREARQKQRPNRVRHPTDQTFTSSCSPPRLTATQLLSVTGRSAYT